MKEMLLPAILTTTAIVSGILAWQMIEPLPAVPEVSGSSTKQISTSPDEDRIPTQPSAPHDSATASTDAPELSPERHCLLLAEHNPRQALILAIQSHLDETTPGLLGNLTTQWAARDFDAALTWVRQQEFGDQRDELFARLAFVASKSDPAAAARLVANEIATGSRQEEAAISVLHQWALRDPAAAAAWATDFPTGGFSERAKAEIEGLRRIPNATTREP